MKSPASILFDINGNPVGVSGSMSLPPGAIGQLVAAVDTGGNVRYLSTISGSLLVTGSFTSSPVGVQTVTGSVALSQPATVQGTVTSVITGTIQTAVTNFPSTQTITGSVSITGQPVSVQGSVTSIITGTVNTNVTNQVTVTTTGSIPVSFSGIQTVTGTVAITGQPVTVQGTVTSVITGTVQTAVQSLPNITGSVNVTNSVFPVTGTVLAFPTGIQTVAGTVTSVITGTVQTSIVGTPTVTAIITGTLQTAVTNFPAVQTVTGSVGISGPVTVQGSITSVITGTVNTNVTNQVTVTTTGSIPVSISGIQNVTGTVAITGQPVQITGSVLALPTGIQTVAGTVTSVITGTVQTSIIGTPTVTSIITGTVNVSQQGSVSVGNFPVIQAVSGSQITGSTFAGSPLVAGAVSAGNVIRSLQSDTGGALYITTSGSLPVSLSGSISVTTTIPQANAATLSNVASSATNVTLLSLNTSRRGALFFNDSNQALFLKFGTTASTTSFTVKISAGGYYEFPQPIYTGQVDGIWSSANGSVRITELT
jgi:hypothetical protein